MILLDTSVLIRHLRTAPPAIREVFASNDCAICGVTWAEVLHGARTTEHASELRQAMSAFVRLPIEEATWDRLGDHLAALRANGLPVPFQDVLLATVAIDHGAELWSYDAHFRLIQGVLTGLRLFDGPNV